MPATRENTKAQIDTQAAPAPRPTTAQVRLAAAIEAAYILEARTR